MAIDRRFPTLSAAMDALSKDLRLLDEQIKDAAGKACWRAAEKMRDLAPAAFGDLRKSIGVYSTGKTGTRSFAIMATAPYAMAVEVGSRPHMPPVSAIEAWVKQRGMQGIGSGGGVISNRIRMKTSSGMRAMVKDHTLEPARKVAFSLRGMTEGPIAHLSGRGIHSGKFTPVDAPRQLAWAIAMGIAKHGTKPHWYVRRTLPYLRRYMAQEIRAAMKAR